MKKWVAYILVLITVINSFQFSAAAVNDLSISAKAALVMCADSKEVIYAHNVYEKLPMASTTKIMTALILAEQPSLDKTVIVTKQMVTVEGSSMGLLEGDTVSYRDLLYGMLLASGNDAANTVAYVLGGGPGGFAKIMNKKAKEIGLKNTNFVTPSGLDDDNHYTTAYDLALLTSVALKNKAFCAACGSKTATLYYGNPPYRRSLTNHNKLLGNYEGLIGVKTGFTKKSGRCLVTAAVRDGKKIIAVTLNAPNDWQDHKNMLDYGFENTVTTTNNTDNLPDTIELISGDADLVKIATEKVEICTTLPKSSSIKQKVLLPKFVYGSLSAGEKVGRVEYYLGEQLIKTANIYSLADVKLFNRKEDFLKRFYSALCTLWNYS